ncbi:SWI/SNF-related matrix-associated actin-dependent regulator of chromatin subfamily A containing DEAD/H box 1A isoform X1 [Paramormyrops kingsleyae]|uniref:SWI/SNF-related matrix-associated actin-dependent regulator of chromatin subfamily A containing DEAD/H box 1A isoform X1 n=1 Tax=Paramormyrops kingsleyae TaxID=1676925 RepID=UPI003B9773B2
MSFNLERFRYQGNERKRKDRALTQDRSGSAKSKQDKENKPSSTAPGTMQGQQTPEPDCQAPVLKTSVQTVEAVEEWETSREWYMGDEEMEEGIRTPSPLDLTMASCLTRQTDKGSAQKQKHGSVDSSDCEESANEMERPGKRKKQDTSTAGVDSGDCEESDNEMERPRKRKKQDTSTAGVDSSDCEESDNEMERPNRWKKQDTSTAAVDSGDCEESDNEMERPGRWKKQDTSTAGVDSSDCEESDNEMERPRKKKKQDTSTAGVDSSDCEESDNEMERPNRWKKQDTSTAAVDSGDCEESDNEMERPGRWKKQDTSTAGVDSGDCEESDNEMERPGKRKKQDTFTAGVDSGDCEESDNEMERPDKSKKQDTSTAAVDSGDSEESDSEMERPGKRKKQDTSTAGVDSGDSEESDSEMERPGKRKKQDISTAGVDSGDCEESDSEMERPGKRKKQDTSTAAVDSSDCEESDSEMERPRKRKKQDTSMAAVDSGDSEESDSEMERPGKRKKQDTSTAGGTLAHRAAHQVAPSGQDKKAPSSVDQGIMVRKLQKVFPELDREELRDILQQHNWNMEQALDELYLSSDLDEPPSSPEVRVTKPVIQQPVTVAHRTGKGACPRNVTKKADKRVTAAKAKKTGRKARGGMTANTSDSTSEEEGNSDFEDSSGDDSDRTDTMDSDLKASIVKFFQQASMDELSLIRSCSQKTAQKIIELRPYRSWRDLERAFQEKNNLSDRLLSGCKVVLKERWVVLELMKKCEAIAGKMMKDLASLIQGGSASYSQPTILNSKMQLKPFQLVGLHWLNLLHQNKLSGILADEMGLGKTIQAISFLASLYQTGNKGPHLIAAPASTIDNWVRELNLWCPKLKVLPYRGNFEERTCLRHDILRRLVDFNVIICTYNMTVGTSSDRGFFHKLKLQYAVFDEGHMLKNMNTMRYLHLMEINAKYRLLLTGTPLQNNLLELMSLLNFIMPSLFSSSTSQTAKLFSAKSSEQSSFEKDRIAHAKLILKPFILRRLKSEVLKQLPAKVKKVEFCPMSEKQQKLYSTFLETLKSSAVGKPKSLNFMMMQLRKMANHPLLHRQYYTSEKLAAMSHLMLKEPTHHDADPALILEDMEVMSDFELHCLCQRYPGLESYQLQSDLLCDSGKFALLTELLASLKQKGDRVVLFSQFRTMLDIMEAFLQQLGHSYIRMDGCTPIADRIVLIDKYNNTSEIFVFLLSTRAGGQGINLTSANVVILHDIDWNPYNDRQAEDCCHRVGQTKTVQVFRLVSQDTIEVNLLQISQKKLRLEQDISAAEEGKEGDLCEDIASLLKTVLGL